MATTLKKPIAKATATATFNTNGDCRRCDWHASYHSFAQGNTVRPTATDKGPNPS